MVLKILWVYMSSGFCGGCWLLFRFVVIFMIFTPCSECVSLCFRIYCLKLQDDWIVFVINISTCWPLKGPSLKLNFHWLCTSPVPSSPPSVTHIGQNSFKCGCISDTFSPPLIWASTSTRSIPLELETVHSYEISEQMFTTWCEDPPFPPGHREMIVSWLNSECNLAQWM
jgi:hypothetical protein